MYSPTDVVCDHDGNLYIADYKHYRVLKVDSNGNASLAAGQSDWIDQDRVFTYQFLLPRGITFGSDNKLYIADDPKQFVWRIDSPLSSDKTIVAGVYSDNSVSCWLTMGCEGMFNGYSGPATEIWLDRPGDAAMDSGGNLAIADFGNRLIRWVDSAGGLTTIAGSKNSRCRYYDTSGNLSMDQLGEYFCPYEPYSGDGGPSNLAQLGGVASIDLDADDTIYFPDNSRVRRIRRSATSIFEGMVTDAVTGQPCPALLSWSKPHSPSIQRPPPSMELTR